MVSHRFCRDLALSRGEPLVGSGASAKRYALLSWPRGSWRVPRTASKDMPSALSDAILTANAAGIHVALVEGDDIALACDGRIVRAAAPEEAARWLVDLAEGRNDAGARDERQTILCCTDAKQDPCCAKFGFATYKAVRERADPTRFRVLQSTHLGGCRFAATLLVLPARARYGRLSVQDVPGFLDCLDEGVPFLPAYRGNPDLDAPAQAAEHAVLAGAREAGLSGAVELALDEDGPQDGIDLSRVYRARIGGAEWRVGLRAVSYAVNTRCRTLEAEAPNDEAHLWHVASLDRLA